MSDTTLAGTGYRTINRCGWSRSGAQCSDSTGVKCAVTIPIRIPSWATRIHERLARQFGMPKIDPCVRQADGHLRTAEVQPILVRSCRNKTAHRDVQTHT